MHGLASNGSSRDDIRTELISVPVTQVVTGREFDLSLLLSSSEIFPVNSIIHIRNNNAEYKQKQTLGYWHRPNLSKVFNLLQKQFQETSCVDVAIISN